MALFSNSSDRRRIVELENLCTHYREQAEKFQARPEYTAIRIPAAEDMPEYYRKLIELDENDFYKYYFKRVYDSIAKAFIHQGKEHSEFFRGKLSAIDDIILDARSARLKISEGGNAI